MAKNFYELELRDDFMFSLIMRDPKYCKPFLERVLGVKIARIEYPKFQETIDFSADAKGVRLDILAEDEKGVVYNIEMQATKNQNLPKRTRYYQGMVDLNILEKGEDYRNLKCSFIIFVCTFDLFGEGRHIYTFENRCIQNPELRLGDEAIKIILNTKGTMDDVTPELKKLLDYIDGKMPQDDFTRELDEAVKSARKNERWRLDYMTLQMQYQEKYEAGLERGLERGKKVLIEMAREFGLSDEAIIRQLQEKMGLSPEEAADCLDRYGR